ncbi:MAG: type II toxin-antitoxin system RelE/ParE family toxin [Deltaproteobacteria bacterium]|nr:type II toxin-antitoxin system RelE/ParE family toxin [Deltaproteobacteria bacterium]MBI4373345.1 type II toxin-antitoxin system RelE/ParE family toxin [Deltaproteobacteria bacterium]
MTTFRVLWTKTAEKDIGSIVDFIALEKPETALKVLYRIRAKAVSLRKSPKRGRFLPELRHIKVLPFREILIPPWRLIYRIQGKTVQVLSVLDGRRDMEEILFERLTET